MNLTRTDIPATVSDLGTTVVEVLPIDVVGDALSDLPVPDLDEATETVAEFGRRSSRGAIAVVGVARRNPVRTALALIGLVAVVTLVVALMTRSSDSADESQLTMADAA